MTARINWITIDKAVEDTGLPRRFFDGLMQNGTLRLGTHYRKLDIGPKGRILLNIEALNKCLAEEIPEREPLSLVV